MRVVYKKSIVERLTDALYEARRHGRAIEKFVLTPAEALELDRTCSRILAGRNDHVVNTVLGIPFEVEP
jgi:hypothetical protein